jgi:hypothetical protein
LSTTEKMKRSRRSYSYLVFGLIQAALTCAVAASIASVSFIAEGSFFSHWIKSWVLSWLTMVPVVAVASPLIRRFVIHVMRVNGHQDDT